MKEPLTRADQDLIWTGETGELRSTTAPAASQEMAMHGAEGSVSRTVSGPGSPPCLYAWLAGMALHRCPHYDLQQVRVMAKEMREGDSKEKMDI